MPEPLQFTKAEHGWAATMPREMALAAGVAEGSLIVLHLEDGTFKPEVLPPATTAMKAEARDIAAKFQDLFAELKRRGD